MRKSTLLKLMLVTISFFVVSGIMAQTPARFVAYDSLAIAPDNIDYVTVGAKLGYYVDPDPLYHPSYDADGSLTIGFTWTWATASTSAQTPTYSAAATNYVEITYPNLGNYKILVRENAPAGYGGCSGPWVALNVTAVASPTINAFPYFASVGATSDGTTPYIICGDMTAPVDVNVNFNGYPKYEIYWNLAVTEIDLAGNPVVNANNNTALVDHTKASGLGQVFGANSLTRETPSANYIMESRTFTSILNAATKKVRTRYTYTIGGVTDNISRKSDALVNPTKLATLWSPYDNGARTYVIIVNPTPVTGPIYHIPNNFGNI